MIDEANTPASFKIGQNFEDYVRKELFVENYYDLLERTHDYNTNKRDYVESSLKPDFKFRDKWTKLEFYIEAKFRTRIYNEKVIWCNDTQLLRYHQYNKQNPVFLILGMGENPKFPDFLSLIPLSKAKYTGLFLSVVEKFEIKYDQPIS